MQIDGCLTDERGTVMDHSAYQDLAIALSIGFAVFLILVVVLAILGTKSWTQNSDDNPNTFY